MHQTPVSPTVPVPAAPPVPTGGGADWLRSHHGLSLLSGWVPPAVQVVALVLLVLAIGWRTRRWRLVWLPVSALLGVAAAVGAWQYMNYEGLASDPAPMLLWVCIGATAGGIGVAVLGWRSAQWWRRAVSVPAVLLAALSSAIVLNQWVGYYPTVQAAWAAATAGPLPQQVDFDELAALRNTQVDKGRIVPVDIPDTASDFTHRTEYVYLPPAWFRGPKPPQLPVIMMIGGEFNTPADWVRSGQILPGVNKFAAANGGNTPILVFVDSGGSFNNDTECVNGPRGNSADHLTKDVPPYTESTFSAAKDPAQWAITGWSMGGTCATTLTVMHPELFHTFQNIAGDIGPASGNKQQTIERLFGGDEAAWAAFDPTTVMQKHGPYTGIAGLYDDLAARNGKGRGHRPHRHDPASSGRPDGMGGRDHAGNFGQPGAARKLCDEGRKVGIDCTVYTTPGGHTWQFASGAFLSALPWLTARTGLPVAAGATAL